MPFHFYIQVFLRPVCLSHSIPTQCFVNRSMMSTDGNELRGSRDKVIVVPCTRWRELQTSIEYHAEMAGLIGATTIFRLLNDPGIHIGPQEFSIGDTTGGVSSPSSKSIQQEVSTAISVIQRARPNGVTPLTYHLKAITTRIEELESVLRRQGQKAVVVIATDGIPSDDQGNVTVQVQNEFVDALKRLQRLPVWIVIRLCTDDETVNEYYNDLDKVLELPMECIDDYLGEAKEIMAVNKWLNYALPLHRCREMGYQHRLFDLLDERPLTKDELYEFLTLLFGASAFRNAPDINTNWTGFYKVLNNVVQTETQEWNPTTQRRGPWIDMKQLNKIYGVKKGLFGFGTKRRK